jgi:small subunit ribosomal protein S17
MTSEVLKDTTAGEARETRQTRVGVVTSAKRSKTIAVSVAYTVQHRKYGKYLRRGTTIHAHDETNECHAGDTVEIAECRPMSKTKHWRLVRIITKAPQEASAVR